MDYKIKEQPIMNKLMPFEGVTFQIPISFELAMTCAKTGMIITQINKHIDKLLKECVKEGDESEHDVTIVLTIINFSYDILFKCMYNAKYTRENGLVDVANWQVLDEFLKQKHEEEMRDVSTNNDG